MKTSYIDFKEVIREETETEVYLYMLQERVAHLKSQGMNKQQIRKSIVNEGLMDTITGAAGALAGGTAGTLWDMAPESVKQTIIEKALEYVEGKLGLNPKGWLISVINKAVANMKSEDWKAVIGGECDTIARVLTEALEEQLLDKLIIKLSGDLFSLLSRRVGISPNGLTSVVGEGLRVALRNQLFEWVKEQEFVANVTDSIAEYICDLDFSDMLEGVATE